MTYCFEKVKENMTQNYRNGCFKNLVKITKKQKKPKFDRCDEITFSSPIFLLKTLLYNGHWAKTSNNLDDLTSCSATKDSSTSYSRRTESHTFCKN